MRKAALILAVASFIPLLFSTAASAADAMVMQLHGGGHFQGAGQPLVEAFTAKTGIKAAYVPGNTGDEAFKERLDAGQQIDVIVVNSEDMVRHVAGGGLIRPGSDVVFARDGYGLATLKSKPMPDISTTEKLRQVLLSAKAVGRRAPDSGNSGRISNQFLVDLGILPQMQGAKTVYIENATADLEAGKVDFVFWSYTEILRNERLHGAAVPSELGGYVTQAIGIPASAKRVADAQAFITFIQGPEAAAILKRWGMEQMPAGRN
jgi:molybdate transport system substrate-binding protein